MSADVNCRTSMQGYVRGYSLHALRLDKQAGSGHFFGLFDTHDCKDRWSNISQNAPRLLEAPALWRVGHDEGNMVRRMRCLGCSFLSLHFLGISENLLAPVSSVLFLGEQLLPVIGSDEENISVLFAGLVYTSDGLVSCRNGLDGSLIHAGVANHVWRSEVVHQELVSLLSDSLREFIAYWTSAHLGVEIVGGNPGGWNHIAHFALELLLHTTVEEERDVRVFLGLSNVALLEILLA